VACVHLRPAAGCRASRRARPPAPTRRFAMAIAAYGLQFHSKRMKN
jgi:hypothetical protein